MSLLAERLKTLTPRQRQVYDAIKEGILKGHVPTLRELAERFGLTSPTGVTCHLVSMEKKGLIKRVPTSARGIELIGLKLAFVEEEPPAETVEP